MTRKTRVRIVGDPELADKVLVCLTEHFECTSRKIISTPKFATIPYRYADSPRLTIYVDVKGAR